MTFVEQEAHFYLSSFYKKNMFVIKITLLTHGGQHPPPSLLKQWGAWKNAKKMQKGGPGKFWFVKGKLRVFSYFAGGWGGGGQVGVGIIFGGGYTPSACHVTLLILKVH